ncbi:DUF1015 family protein [Pedobacter steynii]
MKIKPFAALEPEESWYKETMADFSEYNLIRALLEPKTDSVDLREACNTNLNMLLEKGHYKESEAEAIYIYEKKSGNVIQRAIWTLTSLEDFKQGNIVAHEQTISGHESQLQIYRRETGIEGSPVILTYRAHSELGSLIESLKGLISCIHLKESGNDHRVWKVREQPTLAKFQEVFQKIERVYIADGHHRLAAASKINFNQPQWITTMYISSCQLSCAEFHRMVTSRKKICPDKLFSKLKKYFYISTIQNNVAYKPKEQGQFGMLYNDTWHQLNLKPEFVQKRIVTDVEILQSLILKPIFGIANPKDDHRIQYYPDDSWEKMLSESRLNRNAVIFTLHPMTPDELITQAEQQVNLPPKSTYVEPKIPYGLLLYQNKAAMRTRTENA